MTPKEKLIEVATEIQHGATTLTAFACILMICGDRKLSEKFLWAGLILSVGSLELLRHYERY